MERKLLIPARLDVLAAGNGRIGKLMASEYAFPLRAAYAEMDVSVLYTSRIHGVGHIERTVLLGAMIAHAQALSEEMTRMLLLCCSYHDVGRHNDFRDDLHGENSARKMAQPPLSAKFAAFDRGDFAAMCAAVTTHSISDRLMEETARRCAVPDGRRETYFLLARCLKDADNLDRVRLGDLDTRHLRHPESVAMADDAQWLFDEYRKME